MKIHLWITKGRYVPFLRHIGLQAYTCNPLIVGDRLLGTLSFGSRTREEFNQEDVAFLRTICNFVALAQERAQIKRRLEKRVEDRTTALQATNQQLEAFCYTIAHDLRAPLRAQQGFAGALIQDHGEVLGETGRDYAERIIASAVRLNDLVNDLLAYSRIGRTEMTIEELNLKKIVSKVCDEMAFQIHEAKAKVHLGELDFTVRGHDLMFRTAVTNLISNAIKFSKPGIPPEIHVYAEERDKWIRLWVEDNGIGIAPEHHQIIFGVFHRLHKTGDYPGTGVGLAIVQKGIERMGGRVGLESEEGKGSRFWIELKKPTKAASVETGAHPETLVI